jgi:uncharacterized protein
MSKVYRNDHDNDICNQSENRPFASVLEANISRRTLLKGGLAAATTSFLAGNSLIAKATAGAIENYGGLINFQPVAVADGSGPWPSISPDYQWDVLIPWGEPLEPGGPEFSYPPNSVDQAKQIGIGHDGMHYFPIKDVDKQRCGWNEFDYWDDDKDWYQNLKKLHYRRGNRHGMLCINHEFGRNSHVLDKGVASNGEENQPESLEEVRTSQHAHGVSVVEIKKRYGKWRQIKSERARRIHVNTPVRFSGPVAGSELLATPNGNIPLGTVNNCANGFTPWGTYLTCEENFNGYFGATNTNSAWTPTPEQERYGFSETGFGYGWEKFDQRFDLSDSDYKNEENRFGWIVEIDPMDATQTPVKRTALGRMKHEGIALTIGMDGRVVGYMGDDQRFDYIYKFVSDDNWRWMLSEGRSPLDHGKLYVARFNEDGTGDWLELTIDNPNLAARFSSQAEILTYARIAADIVGATPMDRPEWTTVAPDGTVYCTLTNNSRRGTEGNPGPDAANPLGPNESGHIIRWIDSDQHVGITFNWSIFIIAETTHGTEDTFSDPDGLFSDPDGRLFIQTDGGQPDNLNNQMLVADIGTGELRRMFTGVTKDEITGVAMTPNRKTMFINTQHPGNGDPASTSFPMPHDGVTRPRDATIVITREDGGIVGS